MRNLNRVIAVLVLSFIFLGCESTLYWLKLNQKALLYFYCDMYPGSFKKTRTLLQTLERHHNSNYCFCWIGTFGRRDFQAIISVRLISIVKKQQANKLPAVFFGLYRYSTYALVAIKIPIFILVPIPICSRERI